MSQNFQSCRIMYDNKEVSNANILREKPLKYITDAIVADRKTHFLHPESVDTSSELRQTPTNLNYVDQGRTSTELYGTAPYRGQNRKIDKVDTESELLFGIPMKFDVCNKHLTETEFVSSDQIESSIVIDTDLRSISTRSDLRNTINGCKF